MASPTTFSSSFSSASFAPSADTEEPMADEATAQAWLAEEGFAEGDLRSEITIDDDEWFPMLYACYGEAGRVQMAAQQRSGRGHQDERRRRHSHVDRLREGPPVCVQGLFEVGAAADITKTNNNGATPMLIACQNGRLSVCKWLFEVGAAADITKAMNDGVTPMWIACQNGHLLVCEWLFEVGAAADITKTNDDSVTPMYIAQQGQLLVCKWLFEVGAAADITKTANNGATPTWIACQNGHLPVQVAVRGGRGRGHHQGEEQRLHSHVGRPDGPPVGARLFEVGAAADITKANNTGATPMYIACQHGNLRVQVAVRGGASADITNEQQRHHSHVHRLPAWQPVGASGCSRWALPRTSVRRGTTAVP